MSQLKTSTSHCSYQAERQPASDGLEQCSQLWAYDDLFSFQSSQPELSTQLGKKPAAAFCPSCGAFTLDVGATQAAREEHFRTCREHGEPEAADARSDGEEPQEERQTEETSNSSCVNKRSASENADPEDAMSRDLGGECKARSGSSQREEENSSLQGRPVAEEQPGIAVDAWLQQNDLARHAADFHTAGVGMELLAHLTDRDLQQMGILALGPRRKILAAIQNSMGSAESSSIEHATAGLQVPQQRAPPIVSGVTEMHCSHHMLPASAFGCREMEQLLARLVSCSRGQQLAAESQTSSRETALHQSRGQPMPASRSLLQGAHASHNKLTCTWILCSVLLCDRRIVCMKWTICKI